MQWYKESQYSVEKKSLVSALVSFAKADQPIVETTYKIPFSEEETSLILEHYLNYASISPNQYITNPGENGWLKNPHLQHIVTAMTGTPSYTWEKKGLRDRAWVIMAGLIKLGKSNPAFAKFWKPYGYTPPEKKTEPVVIPDDYKKENKQNTNVLMIIGAIAAGAVTKLLKMW